MRHKPTKGMWGLRLISTARNVAVDLYVPRGEAANEAEDDILDDVFFRP
jgi:hypothetical protein